MVTDKPAYDELIEYLSSNKSVFLESTSATDGMPTVETLIEEEISEQIISLCSQHQELEANHRSVIVREVDGIVYDVQQVLSDFWEQNVTEDQAKFINEFAGLIKNVFDSQIADLID